MNVKEHHTTKELQTFYRQVKNAKLAKRIHGVYLASKGLSCPEIVNITGAAAGARRDSIGRFNIDQSRRPIGAESNKSNEGNEPYNQFHGATTGCGPRGDAADPGGSRITDAGRSG